MYLCEGAGVCVCTVACGVAVAGCDVGVAVAGCDVGVAVAGRGVDGCGATVAGGAAVAREVGASVAGFVGSLVAVALDDGDPLASAEPATGSMTVTAAAGAVGALCEAGCGAAAVQPAHARIATKNTVADLTPRLTRARYAGCFAC